VRVACCSFSPVGLKSRSPPPLTKRPVRSRLPSAPWSVLRDLPLRHFPPLPLLCRHDDGKFVEKNRAVFPGRVLLFLPSPPPIAPLCKLRSLAADRSIPSVVRVGRTAPPPPWRFVSWCSDVPPSLSEGISPHFFRPTRRGVFRTICWPEAPLPFFGRPLTLPLSLSPGVGDLCALS